MFDQSPNQKFATSTTGDMVKEFISQTMLLCFLCKQLVVEGGPETATFVRPNFLNESLRIMQTLLAEEKHHLVYDLSMCFKRRENNTLETRLPINRMPVGLVYYKIWYFAAHSSQKLGME